MSTEAPIDYIPRTRAYYAALGYAEPYRWAHFADVPFSPLRKPLRDCRVAIVTTAAPFHPDKGDQGPRAPYNAAAKFYRVYEVPAQPEPDLRISHVAIDRNHTSAEDQASYLPLRALKRAVTSGRVGAVTRHVFGLPTNRSIRTTVAQDTPDLLAMIKADGADAALLVPNCPVCHQSVTLAARTLEEAGIPTVIMGCARDIVEHVGSPRFLFSDFPLGNAAGPPHDPASQDLTLQLALDLLETATGPRSIRISPLVWSTDHSWKRDYANVSSLSAEDVSRLSAAHERVLAIARALRL